jgi:branched-chain amino acid transport system ATP-binding protein
MAAGLVLERADVRYGQTRALFGISLEVESGSVLAVLGANGAGKSTLGRAASGLVPLPGGRLIFDGTDVTGWAPHRIRRVGLTYLPEGRGIFPGLTVMDNLRMAVRQLDGKHLRRAAVDDALTRFPVLGERTSQRAGSLSGGEQQMLALARALCVRPKLIIADELSLGLAPMVVDSVFDTLASIKNEGITIVLIEQFVHRALAFADECIILSRGAISWRGPADSAGDQVLGQYLGEGHESSV